MYAAASCSRTYATPSPSSGLKHRVGFVERQRPRQSQPRTPAVLFEFPRVKRVGADHPVVDAAMRMQIVRHVRLRILREVSWRRDDGHSEVRSHLQRHHILLQFLTEPDTGVEAIGHDVAKPIIDDHLDRGKAHDERTTGHATAGSFAGTSGSADRSPHARYRTVRASARPRGRRCRVACRAPSSATSRVRDPPASRPGRTRRRP